MGTIEIGTRVLRVGGGVGYAGDKGTVIEIAEGRIRVKWDDKMVPNFYRREEMAKRAGKRTWVKTTVVQAF